MADSFEALLRGVQFRPIEAKAIVKDLQEDAPLDLQREPTNEFDSNAIRVLDPDSGQFLGYVAREVAQELAPLMDDGAAYDCRVNGRMSASVVILDIHPHEDRTD